MNVRKRLLDADPLTREHALATEDVERMRGRVVAAVDGRGHSVTAHAQIACAGAIAAVVLAVVVGISRRWEPAPAPTGVVTPPQQVPAVAGRDSVEPGSANSRRQLQFATPGGTRIIWVFNSDFKL